MDLRLDFMELNLFEFRLQVEDSLNQNINFNSLFNIYRVPEAKKQKKNKPTNKYNNNYSITWFYSCMIRLAEPILLRI